jgi:hypothetical protein
MMFGSKTIRELTQKVETLEYDLRLKQNEIDNLNLYIKGQTDEVRNEKVSFDFKAVKAFSVERLTNEKSAVTVIGYILKGAVKEWYLYCSSDQHERLVKEFEESRK